MFHRVCDYNFQVHRLNGMRTLPRLLLSKYSSINLGLFAQQLNDVLDSMSPYAIIRNHFTLLCVEHRNGLSYGWNRINIDIPGTVLRFHFLMDADLTGLGKDFNNKKYANRPEVVRREGSDNYSVLRSSKVRQHIRISRLEKGVLRGGRILTVGFSQLELGENYNNLPHTADVCELLYKVLGVTTKAHIVFKGFESLTIQNPRKLMAVSTPRSYAYNKTIWRLYPSMINQFDVTAAEYVLARIQKKRKLHDASLVGLSAKQRVRLGVIVGTDDSGSLIEYLYQSWKEIVEGATETSLTNRCFISVVNNFPSSRMEFSDVVKFAESLKSADPFTVKDHLHKLIWSL